ncbi:MAG: hypothetical protein ACKVOE_01755 [Rickettsiales bacterium]
MSATPGMGSLRIDPAAFSHSLCLVVGERAELADYNPTTGDYRVLSIGLEETARGGVILSFEMHRQGPGFKRRFFDVLSLTLSPAGPDGLCAVTSFTCDAGAHLADLPRLLATLGTIITALKASARPKDALIMPLLSKRGQVLWTQALVKGASA